MSQSFFSISFQLVTTQVQMAYDLYINSSSVEGRERYVRIYRRGEVLTSSDLAQFERKYHRIYVAEHERAAFLSSIVANESATTAQKTTMLKESAIHYLKNIFDQDASPEQIGKTVVECREVVEGMISVLDNYSIDDLKTLIASLSFHDFYTYDHSINVSMYSILLYRLVKPQASHEMIMLAGLCGLFHDLGKIQIPTSILNKTEKLTDEEFGEIKKHPGYGKELLHQCRAHLPATIDAETLSRVIFEHHENFNGTGYPRGLSGQDIHLMSRITAIADFFDAVTTKRSYHEPLSPEEALGLMQKTQGKKIDPTLFEIFEKNTKSGKIKIITRKELPDDFDPCQPHQVLPLIESGANEEKDEEKKDDNEEDDDQDPENTGFGNVRVLEPVSKHKGRDRKKNRRLIPERKKA
jgi:HD-GYP domain-containing protein (c-di-GMP phosphodiesterase class II)